MSPGEQFYVAFGRRLQSLRVSRGFTQTQLGLRLTPPVTRASIANLEAGKQRVLLNTFVEIANVLECQPSDLLPSDESGVQLPRVQSQLESELERLEVPTASVERITRRVAAHFTKETK
jgi:transcriptional regulator with XRE-family HTH domain